jgi:hypothetical protein
MQTPIAPVNARTAPEIWPRFDPQFLEYNPSFVRWHDGRVIGIIRRDHFPPKPGRGMVWALRLDDELRPMGAPAPLVMDGEDPRALVHGGDLLVFYVHFERDAQDAITGTSIMMAECGVQESGIVLKNVFPLPQAPLGEGAGRGDTPGWEKNWVPFVIDEDRVGLIYRHDPWEVLVLLRDRARGLCHFEQAYRAEGLRWAWGPIRGGTPPIDYDQDHLVSFFHGSEVVGSRKLYMAGAVLMERRAPFRPVRMTAEPLLVAPYKGGVHRHGWPVAASVIFPLGAERRGGAYRLLCGVDDGEVGIFTVPGPLLDAGLLPVAEVAPDLRLQGMHGAVQAFQAPVWRLPPGREKLDDRALLRFLRILRPEGRSLVDLGDQAGLLAACMGPHYRKAYAVAPGVEEAALLPGNAALNRLDHLVTYPDLGSPPETFWAKKADVDLLRVAGGNLSCSLLELARGMIERSRPVILVQGGELASARDACGQWLAARNYSVEWAFQLCPQWALALPAEKRALYSWFI